VGFRGWGGEMYRHNARRYMNRRWKGDIEGLLVKVAGIESYKMTRCLRFAKPHQVSPITAVEGNDLSVMV
jgi:hypothetical protein